MDSDQLDQINELLDEIVYAANHRADPETAALIEDYVEKIKTLLENE